jgi:hypothetical protein
MKLWRAETDNGMDIRTYIVLAESAEEALAKIGDTTWTTYLKLSTESFKPLGRDVFEAYENRYPDA